MIAGYASVHWTTSVNSDNSSLKEIYVPSLWWLTVFNDDCFGFFFLNFRVELNLSLTEARRKVHNKPINTQICQQSYISVSYWGACRVYLVRVKKLLLKNLSLLIFFFFLSGWFRIFLKRLKLLMGYDKIKSLNFEIM